MVIIVISHPIILNEVFLSDVSFLKLKMKIEQKKVAKQMLCVLAQ